MEYKKSSTVTGAWAKGEKIANGTRAKLVTEARPEPSQYKDKNGNMKMQDVAKVRFEGAGESLNISLNRATVDGLIDAFGSDSKNWINKVLTARTEKMIVSGKRVTALYLVPDGYEMSEDENGFVKIVKIGAPIPTPPEEPPIEEEGISPDDIPFN